MHNQVIFYDTKIRFLLFIFAFTTRNLWKISFDIFFAGESPKTRSTWLNNALRVHEAVYWVIILNDSNGWYLVVLSQYKVPDIKVVKQITQHDQSFIANITLRRGGIWNISVVFES